APTGEERDSLCSPGQWLLVVLGAGAVTTDLRFAGAGGDRSGVPEMAGADSAAVAEARSAGRLRLESIHLADGSEPDADLRPTPARSGVLRRSDPRQSGLGPAGPGAVGIRSGGDQ